MGLPPACVLLPSRRQGVLGSGSSATRCGPSGAAPDSYCLPNRQFLAMQLLGATRTMWSAAGAYPTHPRRARIGPWARGRMTAFLSPSGNCNIGSMAMAAQDAVAAASMRN